MKKTLLFPFKIDHLDPLGQGVSKVSDKITFIPKTLPGEEGEAMVWKEKSKIQFAELTKLTKSSPIRTHPECPHWDQCGGCHYLHTSYQEEIKFKQQNLARLLRMEIETIEVIMAPERFHYRNRIQLHYDKKQNTLGFHSQNHQKIIEVPRCLLPKIEIQNQLKDLYQNSNWKKYLTPQSPLKGHLEIYQKKEKIEITANRPYASGGFTQVNQEMNIKLQNLVSRLINNQEPKSLLELFAGQGNLTENLDKEIETFHLDSYVGEKPSDKFISLDLYGVNALKIAQSRLKRSSFEVLLLDPPRSGFNLLAQWIEVYAPQSIIYVSCDPHTMIRDLQGANLKIEKAYLIDLFPGTYHFETVVLASRR